MYMYIRLCTCTLGSLNVHVQAHEVLYMYMTTRICTSALGSV